MTSDMRVAREETFGPIAPIMRFSDVDEAIRLANDTPFGLNAAAFTGNLHLAWRFAEELAHGTVLINETTKHWDQGTAFGGSKQSGIGRTLSTWLLDAYRAEDDRVRRHREVLVYGLRVVPTGAAVGQTLGAARQVGRDVRAEGRATSTTQEGHNFGTFVGRGPDYDVDHAGARLPGSAYPYWSLKRDPLTSDTAV